MATKPAERNTQAIKASNISTWALDDEISDRKRKQQARKTADPDRRNIYVDGKFRAQLHVDVAYGYAENEMRKGASVFVTKLQYDITEYMP